MDGFCSRGGDCCTAEAALERCLSPEVSQLRADANLVVGIPSPTHLQWVTDEGPVSVLVPVLGSGPATGIRASVLLICPLHGFGPDKVSPSDQAWVGFRRWHKPGTILRM